MRPWLLIGLVAIAGCGHSAPTNPDTTAPGLVQLGPQLLSIEHHPTTASCGVPSGAAVTVVFTRATLSWSGSEWVATPASSAAGSFQLHFRPSGTGSATSIPVTGTISGTAIHQPELVRDIPPWTAQVSFPAGSRGTLSGIASSAGTRFPYAAVDGSGTGSITMNGDGGVVCPGTSFSWTLVPVT